MNKKVNLFLLLSFLFIFILGSSIAYSKYRTEVTGDAQADIANWNISVNGCSITNPDTENSDCFEESTSTTGTVTLVKNFNITDITYDNQGNDNVVDTKIAPGSSGTFKIVIRPNDTEVSFRYTLKAWLEKSNAAIRLYRSDPNSSNKVLLEEDGYSGIISYSPDYSDYEEEITIYVDWIAEVDDETNEVDTELGTNGGSPTLNIPVQIVFEQYKG